MKCSLCGRDTSPSVAYRRVVGWERKGNSTSRKGGSDIALREPRDEFACEECITRLRHGFNVQQESLV